MEHFIYSVKASRSGSRFSGRFKATSMQDATTQATEHLNSFGSGWNVTITKLANQTLAMKQWEKNNA